MASLCLSPQELAFQEHLPLRPEGKLQYTVPKLDGSQTHFKVCDQDFFH